MLQRLLFLGIIAPAAIAALVGGWSLAIGEPFDWEALIKYSVMMWAIAIVSGFTRRRDRDAERPHALWSTLWLVLFTMVFVASGWALANGIATGRFGLGPIQWADKPVAFAMVVAGYLLGLALAGLMVLASAVNLRAAWGSRGIRRMDTRIKG